MRLFSQNPEGRCVYVTPKDALADIAYADWHGKFTPLGLKVAIRVFWRIETSAVYFLVVSVIVHFKRLRAKSKVLEVCLDIGLSLRRRGATFLHKCSFKKVVYGLNSRNPDSDFIWTNPKP